MRICHGVHGAACRHEAGVVLHQARQRSRAPGLELDTACDGSNHVLQRASHHGWGDLRHQDGGRGYQLSITSRTGGVYGAFVNATWNHGSMWVVSVFGNYSAGTGGFDANNNGYDIAYSQLYKNGQWVGTHTTLAYRFGAPGTTSRVPPGGVGSGVSYTLYGATNDAAYMNPVSWSWYVGGTLQSNRRISTVREEHRGQRRASRFRRETAMASPILPNDP